MSTTISLRPKLRRGFTLVELVVVIVIMATVAALVTASVSGVAASSREDVTRVAFANIRAAVFGTNGRGYFADVRALPTHIADLFRQPLGPPNVPLFDPVARVGWRGPYLSPQHALYRLEQDIDDAHGFTLLYGDVGDPVPRDGWLRPIVLQIPDADGDGFNSPEDLRHARLVSAGDDGVIDTPRTDAESVAPGNAHLPWLPQCNDDLVLYLRVADVRPRPIPPVE
jgi:prepilin-type N-terminal cleavage/methylation domain-containing protein